MQGKKFHKEKRFVNKIVEQLRLSKAGTHASVILFSHVARLKIKFSDHFNVKGFKRAVRAMRFMGSTTRIDKALKLAHEEMFQKDHGMRPNVPRTLILLTDGRQTNVPKARPPSEAVRSIHRAGIKVIAIGIGRFVDRNELRSIVKSPKDLFLPKDFDDLNSPGISIAPVIDAICDNTGK